MGSTLYTSGLPPDGWHAYCTLCRNAPAYGGRRPCGQFQLESFPPCERDYLRVWRVAVPYDAMPVVWRTDLAPSLPPDAGFVDHNCCVRGHPTVYFRLCPIEGQ